MKKTEVRKAFSDRNKIKDNIKKLSAKLWKTSMSSPDFENCQARLKQAQQDLIDQYPTFQMALALTLCPGTVEAK